MSNDQGHTTAPEDRVPWNLLIAYGMGGLIPIALFNIAGQLMGLLGNISLGLSAFWLGTIMIIPRLWDAIADPIIGHISDNTRSRWGRRRPYILFGGIAVALSFVAMWWVPRGEWVRDIFPTDAAYDWFQLAYILGATVLFFAAASIFEIPHGALGMEMSGDYHERTRLFSAKSFLGNLFAFGTPWLIALAGLDLFAGTGGDLIDGMRYLSILIAALIIPMTCWWFFSLREPGFAVAKEQRKFGFWDNMQKTASSSAFMRLVAIFFILAMGFNFVALFNYYITIFYLFGGDTDAASRLLGWNGLAWAFTALLAVFPLNWLGRWMGKNKTLLFAILLMCAAQLSKIFCYNPELPYLVLVPTILLSAGMLMFFTLGSSMVGDVCDEDELATGTRSEGSFYSVFWLFIQTGTAIASFGTGVLLVFTTFDEQQNVSVEALRGNIAQIKAEAEKSLTQPGNADAPSAEFVKQIEGMIANSDKLRNHFAERVEQYPDQAEHLGGLVKHTEAVRSDAKSLQAKSASREFAPKEIVHEADALLQKMTLLKQQTPSTLLRLRAFEIGVPLALSIVSLLLTLRYPLTEARCYEIKEELKKRHSGLTA